MQHAPCPAAPAPHTHAPRLPLAYRPGFVELRHGTARCEGPPAPHVHLCMRGPGQGGQRPSPPPPCGWPCPLWSSPPVTLHPPLGLCGGAWHPIPCAARVCTPAHVSGGLIQGVGLHMGAAHRTAHTAMHRVPAQSPCPCCLHGTGPQRWWAHSEDTAETCDGGDSGEGEADLTIRCRGWGVQLGALTPCQRPPPGPACIAL